ncbi:MAG: ABC transporter permease [Deltaproteobacteria bacterium]|nr:ABC transporter permease [Deltaproteobacteria bacterium]
MIRPSRVGAIARFELVNVVKRPTFLLATFGLPIFLAVVGGVLGLVQSSFLQRQLDEIAVCGIVDEAGLLADDDIWSDIDALEPDERAAAEPIADGPLLVLRSVVFRRFDTEEEGEAALRDDHLPGGLFVIAEDYIETGTVAVFTQAGGPVISARHSAVEPTLARLLRDRLLRVSTDAEVSADVRKRVLDPLEIERTILTSAGAHRGERERTAELVLRMGIPFLLGIFLLTALLFSSGYLVQTVAVDKESKIIEVMLSSADPNEILLGKLLGLGAAGLIQLLVWGAMALFGVGGVVAYISTMQVAFPWEAIMVAPLFFALGYLFIGSLMIATGSLGSSVAESQKLTIGWAILAVTPLMVLLILLEEPHGPLGRVFSVIPFTAPLTLMVRLSVDPDGVALSELALAVASLILATWVAIRIGARLFRVGLLLGGSRPSWREIAKQAKLLD